MLKTLFQTLWGVLIYILFFILFNVILNSIEFGTLKIVLRFLLTFGVIFFFIYYKSKLTMTKVNENLTIKNWLRTSIYFVLCCLAYLTILHIYALFKQNNVDFQIIRSLGYVQKFFTISTLSIVIGCILEELLFRYFVFDFLIKRHYSFYVSAVVSSLLFSAFHYFTYDLIILMYVFIVGFTLSSLYYLTKSIGAAIGVHFIINFLSSLSSEGDNTIITYDNFFECVVSNEIINLFIVLTFLYWLIIRFQIKSKRDYIKFE